MPMHDWTRVDAGTYHDFHQTLIVLLKTRLNELLPPAYYALAEQQVSGPVPDVLTLSLDTSDPRVEPDDPWGTGGGGGGGTATLVETHPKAKLVECSDDDVYLAKQNRLAIRTATGDRLVAIVEIVSPGNRGAGSHLRSFIAKCHDLMRQGIHLLVIDPFPPDSRAPQGLHALIFEEFSRNPVAVPPDRPLSLFAYECRRDVRAYLETLTVGDPLPEMPVFLPLPDRFVEVPIEDVYMAAWKSMPARWQRVIENSDGPTA